MTQILVPANDIVTSIGRIIRPVAFSPLNLWAAGEFWRHNPSEWEAAIYYVYAIHGKLDGTTALLIVFPTLGQKLQLEVAAIFSWQHIQEATNDLGHEPTEEELALHFMEEHAGEFGSIFTLGTAS